MVVLLHKKPLTAKQKEEGRFKEVLKAYITLGLLEKPGDKERIMRMIFSKLEETQKHD
jgi:hypothetical protein